MLSITTENDKHHPCQPQGSVTGCRFLPEGQRTGWEDGSDRAQDGTFLIPGSYPRDRCAGRGPVSPGVCVWGKAA